jgi:hypothetical protein
MLETILAIVLGLAIFSNPRAFVGIAIYLCFICVVFGGLTLALITLQG